MKSKDPRADGGAGAMLRFVAIDGLRAWMAWLVVASHVVQQADLRMAGGLWTPLFVSGNWAVQAFIVTSGFVITHLVVQRPQGYRAYLIPRFMRLFPAFAVATAFGGFAFWLGSRIGRPDWFASVDGEQYRAQLDHLWLNVAAHAVMLHGAIPNSLLFLSQYAFLPPAWSVSLEWQFYLVAPFLVRWCRRGGAAMALVFGAAVLAFAYHRWLEPGWRQPSVLIGALPYFLAGIGCRLAAPSLAGLVSPPAAFGLVAGAFALNAPGLAFWLIAYGFILAAPESRGRTGDAYAALMRALLESRPIRFLAERSYSTYLLHWPILLLVGAVATRLAPISGPPLALVLCLAFPLTLLLQEGLYRLVENPGRALGRRWAERLGSKAEAETPAETVKAAEAARRRGSIR